MKETLFTKAVDEVRPYLDANGSIAPGTYRDTINAIHTDVVSQAVSNLGHNRVIGSKPLPISKKEKFLPRQTRATLSQLRSGFCSRLRDYQHRIGSAQDDNCPLCYLEPQSVNHIFNCPARPTQLVPEDLWSFPVDVASYLSTHPSFDIPRPPPPPPQRRRRGWPPAAPPPSPAPASQYVLFSPLSIPSSLSLDFSSLSIPSTDDSSSN